MDKEVFTGNKIKTLRKKYNLTQKDLAKEIGTTSSKVSQWETGFHKISKSYQYILNDFFVKIKYKR